MSFPVEVDIVADLQCELDARPISVHAHQGVIVVRVESRATATSIIRHIRRFGRLRTTISRMNSVLLSTSQRLELHVADTEVMTMGFGTDSGILRFAGMPNVKVWPFGRVRRSGSP